MSLRSDQKPKVKDTGQWGDGPHGRPQRRGRKTLKEKVESVVIDSVAGDKKG